MSNHDLDRRAPAARRSRRRHHRRPDHLRARRRRRTTPTKVFKGQLQARQGAGLGLPAVHGADRRAGDRGELQLQADHVGPVTRQRRRHRHLRPVRHRARQRRRLPRLVGRRAPVLPDQPDAGHAGLPGRPDQPGPLADRARPLPDRRRRARRTRSRVTLHYGKAAPASGPMPRAALGPGTGPGWYRGDLHVHTVHSDGSQTQAGVRRCARPPGSTSSAPPSTTPARRRGPGAARARRLPGHPRRGGHHPGGHWLAAGLPAGTWIDWRYRPEDGKLARFTAAGPRRWAASRSPRTRHPGRTRSRWDFGVRLRRDGRHRGLERPVERAQRTQPTKRGEPLARAAHRRGVQAGRRQLRHPQVGQQIGCAQTVVRAEALSVDAIIAGYRGGHSWITGSVGVDLRLHRDARRGRAVSAATRCRADRVTTVAVRLEVTGVAVGWIATLIGPGRPPSAPRSRTRQGR